MISPKVEPPHMFMKKPLKIVWEDNWAREITGECSEWLNETLDKADKNSRWWGESMFGIHPKSKPWGYPYGHMEVYYTGTHSRPDTLHNALGHSSGHGEWFRRSTSMSSSIIKPSIATGKSSSMPGTLPFMMSRKSGR